MVLAFVAISGVVGELVKGFLVSQRTLAQLSETEHLALAIAPLYEKQDVEALYAYSSEWTKQTGGRVLLLDTDAVVQLDTASEFNGYRLPYR